jgi:hypothetical protein
MSGKRNGIREPAIVSPIWETECWNRKMIPEPDVERIPHLKELEKGGREGEGGETFLLESLKGF